MKLRVIAIILLFSLLLFFGFKKISDNKIVSEIWNLEEGIDGWSRYIDPSIPRY